MVRPSNRELRRRELALAFERALARHGIGGATIAAVAEEAGVAPGLVHHHFRDRTDLVVELVRSLMGRFRSARGDADDPEAFLTDYVHAALSLGSADRTAARAWVGLFAEAIRSPRVLAILQRSLREELAALEACFSRLGMPRPRSAEAAAGTLATIIGCLVFGALMPGHASGFAAPFVRRMLRALEA